MPVGSLEAMAMARPIVTSNVCGMKDTFRDSQCGILTAVDDISAIAAAIGSLADNPEARREMGRNSRNLIRDRYSWPQIADDYLKLIYRAAPRLANTTADTPKADQA